MAMNLAKRYFPIDRALLERFHKCVARYHGDPYLKSLLGWDQFLAMGVSPQFN